MADTPPGAAAPQSPAPTPPWSPPTLPPVPQPPPDLPAGLPAVQIAGQRQGLSGQRLVVMIGAILLIAVCAVLMLVELGEPAGVTPLVIGLVAAVLPVPVLVACFLWLDRYEPEPIKYLLFCFGWGAAVSTYSALQVNTFAGDAGLPVPLVGVLVAPFIEELTKALGPFLLLLYRRRQWSGITDGIVYCGLSAVGFAMVENILYLGLHGYADGADQYGPASGAQNVFAIFIMRVLITGFAHPLFTSMTGVGLGIAARSADLRIRILTPIAGLLLAMILHGTWNLTATLVQETGETLILLYGYIGLMVPIFLGMVGLAIWLRSWEGRITERRLPGYVRAGWLTPPELAALTNIGRRHAARRWARRVAGDEGFKAMRRFQFAATRLALLRDGLTRGLDAKPIQRARALAEERELLGAMYDARRAFVGRDPQAPAGVWDGRHYHLTFPDGSLRTLEAPHEPVVPIPVVLATPRLPAPAGLGYNQFGPPGPFGQYGPPGVYGPPGAYNAPGAYGAPGHYGAAGTPGPYGAPGQPGSAPPFGGPPGTSWPGPQQHR